MIHISLKCVLVAAAAGLFATSAARATYAVIQPNEAASKDTFTYSAIPSGLPFGSATYLGASLESSGVHTVHSLIQFDLTGLSTLKANDLATFKINTRSKAGTPFSTVASDPSATSPITVDAYLVTSAWDEATVTYSTEPTIAPTAIGSFVVSGVGQIASLNLTSVVAGWLAAPATNFGIELRQHAIVTVPGAPDAAVVFDSAGGPVAPSLVITPEPTTLAAIAGVGITALRRRRR